MMIVNLTRRHGLWLMAFLVAAVAACGQGQPDKVKQVTEGKLKEAKASWWGFDAADSTAILQAAIDSGVPKLTIEKLAQPWVIEPLKLRDNLELVFEEGVELLAKPGSFMGSNDSLLNIVDGRNIVLRGEGDGATLRMRREDYDAPPYSKAEWRMVINIRGCQGLTIENLTLADSGGDGIYFGVGAGRSTCENVIVRDVICDGNYRQGVSVISARNVLMERVIMRNTGGTPPQAGIDWEPNDPREEITNFVMRDCVAEDNVGAAYVWYLPNLHADSKPVSVTLENCVARGNHPSTFVVITANREALAVGGFIKAVDCTFEGGRNAGVSIADVPAQGGLQVTLENCRIVNPAAEATATPPIVLSTRNMANQNIGNVVLNNVTIVDPIERQPIGMHSWSPGIGVDNLSGTINLVRGGKTETIELTDERIAEWMPVANVKRVAPYSMRDVRFGPAGQAGELAAPKARLRKIGSATAYAEAGQAVALKMRSIKVGQYAAKPVQVTVSDEAGEQVASSEIPFEEEGAIEFTAPKAGTYTLAIDAGPHAMVFTEANVPLVLDGFREPMHLMGATGTFYVLVPKGVREFGIGFYGENVGEGVKATVYDPAGTEVWAEDNITQPKFFIHERTTDGAEVWSIKLEKPSNTGFEDYYLDLMGIPRFLASSPASLLQPVE